MKIDDLIEHLWVLSRCDHLQGVLADYNRDFRCNFYQDRDRYIKEIAPEVSKTLVQAGQEPSQASSERLVWFILMLPIEEYTDVYRCNVKSLIFPIHCMFRRLIEEAIVSGVITEKDATEYFQALIKAARVVTQFRPSLQVSGYNPGSMKFYGHNTINPVFEYFSLSMVAHLNHRLWDATYEKAMHIKRHGDPEDYFPLNNQLNDAYPIFANMFDHMNDHHVEPINLSIQDMWAYMEAACIGRNFVYRTRDRWRSEFNVFKDATIKFKTLISGPPVIQRNELAVKGFLEENDHLGAERAILLADLSEGLENEASEDKTISQGEGLAAYLSSIRREKIAAHFRSGGHVLLRHCWSDKRSFTLERLAALLGFITQGEQLQALLQSDSDRIRGISALCILETATTGASIERILTGSKGGQASGGFIDPAGLYIDIDELLQVSGIQVDSGIDRNLTLQAVKSLIREFNDKFPELHITPESLAYGGRAWHINKGSLNRLEVSHICGVVLPGVRASLQYVNPNGGLISKLIQSNSLLLKHLLKISTQSEFKVLDKLHPTLGVTNIVRAAYPVIEEYGMMRETLELKRHEIYCKTQFPQIPEDHKIEAIFKYLVQQIHNEKDGEVNWLSAFVLAVLHSSLLLRPGEAKTLPVGNISFQDNVIMILGKGNIHYVEVRFLPMSTRIKKLFQRYVKEVRLEKLEGLGSTFIHDHESAVKHLNFAFDHAGMGHYDLYSLRKWGATRLHNSGIDFDEWQGLMGHSQVGFEFLGRYSTGRFSRLRKHFDELALFFNRYIEEILGEVKIARIP